MLGATCFFDDDRYLRTVRAERRPPSAARYVPGSVILDAGCGEGRNAVPLARAGYRVVGLDRSRRLLRAAPRHARLRLVCGSYERMPFRDSTFDAVLLLGTALGYSAEAADRRALGEARRVLAPGGRLVIETLHRDVPDWERDGNQSLRREFKFADFNAAFGLVARVALLAEAESHHPEIELEWGRAAFRLYTHTASGLSRNDFIMAAKVDQLAQGA